MSNGDEASVSGSTSPTSVSPSGPCASDMEVTSSGKVKASRTLAGVIPASPASSSAVGRRPCWASNSADARRMRPTSAPAWTGSRMVRPLLAMAREMAWRIHHVP